LEQKEKQLEALNSTKKSMEDNRTALQAERGTELTKTLTDDEQDELKVYRDAIES